MSKRILNQILKKGCLGRMPGIGGVWTSSRFSRGESGCIPTLSEKGSRIYQTALTNHIDMSPSCSKYRIQMQRTYQNWNCNYF